MELFIKISVHVPHTYIFSPLKAMAGGTRIPRLHSETLSQKNNRNHAS